MLAWARHAPPTCPCHFEGIDMDSSEKRKAHRNEAARLKAAWHVISEDEYYSYNGRWYMRPAKFPAALFDPHGYVLFRNEEKLRECPHYGTEGGTKINFKKPGISDLHDYVQMIDRATTLPPEEAQGEYVPDKEDRRGLIRRQIKERRGQQLFRDALRKRYGDRCQVTGCKLLDVLEAAHIRPYRGENDNHVGNGLLLRADIHTLFDLNLIGIEPKQMRIKLHPAVVGDAHYAFLDGKTLDCGSDRRPSVNALRTRFEEFIISTETDEMHHPA
jgi:hypothetical protein